MENLTIGRWLGIVLIIALIGYIVYRLMQEKTRAKAIDALSQIAHDAQTNPAANTNSSIAAGNTYTPLSDLQLKNLTTLKV